MAFVISHVPYLIIAPKSLKSFSVLPRLLPRNNYIISDIDQIKNTMPPKSINKDDMDSYKLIGINYLKESLGV